MSKNCINGICDCSDRFIDVSARSYDITGIKNIIFSGKIFILIPVPLYVLRMDQ